ncbi:WXG100 family type VII secretion target [Streptomyces sp. NPDC020412]|uniref:WXG100 family type VII secretion target n=1 Tax=Streptomyces sp. NPDC020412 TaxID=3365073 RepID=UPI00379052A0
MTGYRISSGGLSDQAKELDGCGDDAGKIRQAVDTTMCYTTDALGGSDAGPAYNAFATAWVTETRTLEEALHELAEKVRLARRAYRGSDRQVQGMVRAVPSVDGQGSAAPAEHPSKLSTY